MPLVSGKEAATKKWFSENVRREVSSGRSQKQALAIAYAQKRKAGKRGGR